MVAPDLQTIIEQVDQLPVATQLRLIAHLVKNVRQGHQAPVVRRSWRDIRGLFPYPMFGEDAQAWVSRTRQESDSQRMQHWKD